MFSDELVCNFEVLNLVVGPPCFMPVSGVRWDWKVSFKIIDGVHVGMI